MNLELIKTLCNLKSNQVYNVLFKYLKNQGYKKIAAKPHYIIAEGTIPICLIAHIDTVFSHCPKMDDFIYDSKKTVLWAPHGSGFDDRAGVYAILELVRRGHRPHIIFTDLEENGGIGSSELIKDVPQCPFKKCKVLIQLDRAYEKDAVFYNCQNNNFTKYIESFGFEEEWGTFTDISIIAPAWGIAAVNLSVGYLEEHTGNERLVCCWLDSTIEKVEKILNNAGRMKKYKYIPGATRMYPISYFESPKENDEYFCVICGNRIKETPAYIEVTGYPICETCYKDYYLT